MEAQLLAFAPTTVDLRCHKQTKGWQDHVGDHCKMFQGYACYCDDSCHKYGDCCPGQQVDKMIMAMMTLMMEIKIKVIILDLVSRWSARAPPHFQTWPLLSLDQPTGSQTLSRWFCAHWSMANVDVLVGQPHQKTSSAKSKGCRYLWQHSILLARHQWEVQMFMLMTIDLMFNFYDHTYQSL